MIALVGMYFLSLGQPKEFILEEGPQYLEYLGSRLVKLSSVRVLLLVRYQHSCCRKNSVSLQGLKAIMLVLL